MLSLKNFQDAKLANDAISKISEYGKDFIPQVFDYYEPLKKKYDASYTQSIVDIWVNEEANKSSAAEQFAGSHLMMQKKKGHKV